MMEEVDFSSQLIFNQISSHYKLKPSGKLNFKQTNTLMNLKHVY